MRALEVFRDEAVGNCPHSWLVVPGRTTGCPGASGGGKWVSPHQLFLLSMVVRLCKKSLKYEIILSHTHHPGGLLAWEICSHSENRKLGTKENKGRKERKGRGRRWEGGWKRRSHIQRFIIERRLSLVEQTRSLSLKTESGGNLFSKCRCCLFFHHLALVYKCTPPGWKQFFLGCASIHIAWCWKARMASFLTIHTLRVVWMEVIPSVLSPKQWF